MQVILMAEPDTITDPNTSAYFARVVREALEHYGERITRVVAHLHGSEARRLGRYEGIRCTLEASVIGLDRMVVHGDASFMVHAMHRAVGKLDRALAPFMAQPLRGASLRPASGECLDEARFA